MLCHTSRLFLSNIADWESGGFRLVGPMPKPIRRAPKFGAFLEKLRGELSRPYVMTQLRRYGVDIDQSTLQKAEREGRVPPLSTIRGLALVYKHPFTQMLDKLIQEESGQPVNWPAELGLTVTNSKAEPVKLLVTRPTIGQEFASPTPEAIGNLVTYQQGDSQHDHVVGTGATGSAPSPRRPPSVNDRAGLARALMDFADAIKSDLVQQTLTNAAGALAGDEGGNLGADRAGKDPKTGSGGGRHHRRGKR